MPSFHLTKNSSPRYSISRLGHGLVAGVSDGEPGDRNGRSVAAAARQRAGARARARARAGAVEARRARTATGFRVVCLDREAGEGAQQAVQLRVERGHVGGLDDAEDALQVGLDLVGRAR